MRWTVALFALLVFVVPVEAQECAFDGDLHTPRTTNTFRLKQPFFDQGIKVWCFGTTAGECEDCGGQETSVLAEVLMNGAEVRFIVNSISCEAVVRSEINHCDLAGTLLPAEESGVETFYWLFRPLGHELLPVFCSELVSADCEKCLKEDVTLEAIALEAPGNYYFSVTKIDC